MGRHMKALATAMEAGENNMGIVLEEKRVGATTGRVYFLAMGRVADAIADRIVTDREMDDICVTFAVLGEGLRQMQALDHRDEENGRVITGAHEELAQEKRAAGKAAPVAA